MNFVKIERTDKKSLEKAAPMFHGHEDALVRSCLCGCGGDVYVNHLENPTIGFSELCSFLFFSHGCNRAQKKRLIAEIFPSTGKKEFHICADDKETSELLQKHFQNKDKYVSCTYIRKQMGGALNQFPKEKLVGYVKSLPTGYSLVQAEETLYTAMLKKKFDGGEPCAFSGYEEFAQYGNGVVLFAGDQPIGSACSFCHYKSGVETDIAIAKEYRGKGLSKPLAAAFLLSCLEKAFLPHWNAANDISRKLAEDMGFQLLYEYENFYVREKE